MSSDDSTYDQTSAFNDMLGPGFLDPGEQVVWDIDPTVYQFKPTYDSKGNIVRLTIVRV